MVQCPSQLAEKSSVRKSLSRYTINSNTAEQKILRRSPQGKKKSLRLVMIPPKLLLPREDGLKKAGRKNGRVIP